MTNPTQQHDLDRLRRQARRLARRDPRHVAIATALDRLAQRRPALYTPWHPEERHPEGRHPGGRHHVN